jgi:hypothetical protein
MIDTPTVLGLLIASLAAPRGAYSVRAVRAACGGARVAARSAGGEAGRRGVWEACLGRDSAGMLVNYFNYFIFNYYFNTQSNIGNYARAVDLARVPPPPPYTRIRKSQYLNESQMA